MAAGAMRAACEIGERIDHPGDAPRHLAQIDDVDTGQPREDLLPDLGELAVLETTVGDQDRPVEIRDPGIHEAEKTDAKTTFHAERQIEDRRPVTVLDDEQKALHAAGLADRCHPHGKELARLVDVHRQLRVGIDRRPVDRCQRRAIVTFDREPSRAMTNLCTRRRLDGRDVAHHALPDRPLIGGQ